MPITGRTQIQGDMITSNSQITLARPIINSPIISGTSFMQSATIGQQLIVSNSLLTNGVLEETLDTGVTVDGILCKDGNIAGGSGVTSMNILQKAVSISHTAPSTLYTVAIADQGMGCWCKIYIRNTVAGKDYYNYSADIIMARVSAGYVSNIANVQALGTGAGAAVTVAVTNSGSNMLITGQSNGSNTQTGHCMLLIMGYYTSVT